jgi:hypothetical protein
MLFQEVPEAYSPSYKTYQFVWKLGLQEVLDLKVCFTAPCVCFCLKRDLPSHPKRGSNVINMNMYVFEVLTILLNKLLVMQLVWCFKFPIILSSSPHFIISFSTDCIQSSGRGQGTTAKACMYVSFLL